MALLKFPLALLRVRHHWKVHRSEAQLLGSDFPKIPRWKSHYPPVNSQILLCHGPVESSLIIVDLAIETGDFPELCLSLPEGREKLKLEQIEVIGGL